MRSKQRFLGELVLDRMAPVANYDLVELTEAARHRGSIARVTQYSRWSEPGIALTARLLERSDRGFLADALGELPLTITLSVGPSAGHSAPVEVVRVTGERGDVLAAMMSPVRNLVTSMPALPPTVTMRDAILQVLLWILGWHRHPAPVPPPLTEVPILQRESGSVVALADIPPHPRAHLLHRLGLKNCPATIPAAMWLHFIGEVDAPSGSTQVS